MFITPDEAEKRLKGDRNYLRDKPLREDKEEKKEEEKPWEEPEIDTITLPSISKSPDTLAELEQLIAHGHKGSNGRAHYKGSREVQKALAESDALLGPSMTASILGLSPSQAHAYGDGLQTTHTKSGLRDDKVIKEVRDHVERVKLDIAVKATSRLHRVVQAINGPRIDSVENPMDLARLGKDLALIVEKVTPHELIDPDRGNIHIYRPESSQTNEYKIININLGARQKAELDEKEKIFLARTVTPDERDKDPSLSQE
jgi:hypothetical protein